MALIIRKKRYTCTDVYGENWMMRTEDKDDNDEDYILVLIINNMTTMMMMMTGQFR